MLSTCNMKIHINERKILKKSSIQSIQIVEGNGKNRAENLEFSHEILSGRIEREYIYVREILGP